MQRDGSGKKSGEICLPIASDAEIFCGRSVSNHADCKRPVELGPRVWLSVNQYRANSVFSILKTIIRSCQLTSSNNRS